MGVCLPQNDIIAIAEKTFYYLSNISEAITTSKEDEETNFVDIDDS